MSTLQEAAERAWCCYPHLELLLSDMVKGGVTTVIGLTGTDDVTKEAQVLIAKANGLTE